MRNFWTDIPKPVIGLSPMDGVTDAPFRAIVAKYGRPDVVFTEFVNIQSAFYSPHTLLKDFTYTEIERPIVAQIYGRTPELFYKVAHIVCELGFNGLDINMGCPAKKVAATGCGAALIRTPELARAIIRAAKAGATDWSHGQTLAAIGIESAVIEQIKTANRLRNGDRPLGERHAIPVSVKTRLGYDHEKVAEWIPTLLDEQPIAISLHGRTLQQGYKGAADWDAIARAVELAKGSGTMVLGNGDVQGMTDACKRINDSHVDGVLIGRGAQGNPWVFQGKNDLKVAVKVGEAVANDEDDVSLEERFRVVLEHCRLVEQQLDPRLFITMRKHLTWYCRNFRNAAELRGRMVRVSSSDEVEPILERYLREHAPEDHDVRPQGAFGKGSFVAESV